MRARLRQDRFKVHPHEIELEAERGQVLANLVMQELGKHAAVELHGLEGAQHGAPQFLFGGIPGRDFARQNPGIPDRAFLADGENGDVPESGLTANRAE